MTVLTLLILYSDAKVDGLLITSGGDSFTYIPIHLVPWKQVSEKREDQSTSGNTTDNNRKRGVVAAMERERKKKRNAKKREHFLKAMKNPAK